MASSSSSVNNPWTAVLTRGFDQNQDFHPIQASHFIPCNQWSEVQVLETIDDPCKRGHYDAEGVLVWETKKLVVQVSRMVDESTGDRYVLDAPSTKRLKCLALLPGTIIFQPIAFLLSLVNKMAKIISMAYFWYPSDNADDSFKTRLFELGKDVLRIALTPLLYVGMILASSYGIVRPYDGGKLFATLERVAFGAPVLSPCFQPSPKSHLFGGDINTPNSW